MKKLFFIAFILFSCSITAQTDTCGLDHYDYENLWVQAIWNDSTCAKFEGTNFVIKKRTFNYEQKNADILMEASDERKVPMELDLHVYKGGIVYAYLTKDGKRKKIKKKKIEIYWDIQPVDSSLFLKTKQMIVGDDTLAVVRSTRISKIETRLQFSDGTYGRVKHVLAGNVFWGTFKFERFQKKRKDKIEFFLPYHSVVRNGYSNTYYYKYLKKRNQKIDFRFVGDEN